MSPLSPEITYIDVETVLAPFSAEQQEFIWQHTGVLQITVGCSSQCSPLCWVQPQEGVVRAFTYESLEKAIRMWGKTLDASNAILYWRNDPLDWREGEKTIVNIIEMAQDVSGWVPQISTGLPEHAFDIAYQMYQKGLLTRVSMPFSQANDVKTFYTADRIDRWIKYVMQREGMPEPFQEGDIDAMKHALPIQEVEHFPWGLGLARNQIIITPFDVLGTSGIYFHRAYCHKGTYLKEQVTPDNFTKYQEALIKNIMAIT
ncbi:MAG: hypothetical protein ABIG95_05605 [Candidatus Woesearchaeota archaeon]